MDESPTTESDAEAAPEGLVQIRGALFGLGLLWLTAIAGFGTLQAAIYGLTHEPVYMLLAIGAAGISITAGYASLRAFGLR